MAQTQTFRVDRVIEISEAVALIGDNRYLDGSTSFKVGMQGDHCKDVVKNFIRERDKIVRDAQKRQRAALDKAKDGTNEEKAKANEEVASINEEAQQKMQDLSSQEVEIKVVPLKLSEFIAKADITDVFVKDGVPEAKVVVKAGNSLVPVKFFTLMGDVVKDDRNTEA